MGSQEPGASERVMTLRDQSAYQTDRTYRVGDVRELPWLPIGI